MGSRTDLDPRLLEAVRGFVRRTQVQRVIVFGSQATGDARDHSDVDLLVVDPRFEGQRPFERPVTLYDDWPKEIPVDFLCYTPDEFEELKDRPSIVQAAVEEGVAVA